MNDNVWQAIRYAMIGIGSFFAGRGKIDPAHVAPLADDILSILSGAMAFAATAWGFYVKWRTVAVPVATGVRSDVPTVSGATGIVHSGPGIP